MDTKGKKIVYYVEDEPDLIELCGIAFGVSGIDMKSALSGEDALVFLEKIIANKKEYPDAFVLDILLPGISGIEIMREIRKHKDLDNIPIVIFTNYSDKKIKNEVKNTGNAYYILKTDVVPSQLAKIVRKKINEYHSL